MCSVHKKVNCLMNKYWLQTNLLIFKSLQSAYNVGFLFSFILNYYFLVHTSKFILFLQNSYDIAVSDFLNCYTEKNHYVAVFYFKITIQMFLNLKTHYTAVFDFKNH